LLLATLALASLASLARAAHAEGLAPRLVRSLHRPGRAHPLADARGRIPLSIRLPAGADAASLGLLPVAPGIGALRLAPEEVPPFAAAHPNLPISVAGRLYPLLDVSPEWTHVTAFRKATGGLDGKGVVVGVVDTGLDVRHPDFRTKDGHTRVAWMLVQGAAPKGLHPDVEQTFGCNESSTSCAVYAAADIDAVIANGADELHDGDGHGTHVASIAAGNGGPSVTKTPRFVGLAPEASLVIVGPNKPGEGFLDTDILNGARFVFDRADAMGSPVVLNLSLGSDYGSHDGTSDIEKGLTAFVGDQHPGHVIVVAAGNSGGLDSQQICANGDPTQCVLTAPLGIHTEAHVFEGEVVRVPMMVTNAAPKGHVLVWITFRPGDDVSVALDGPCGATWVGYTAPGDSGGYSSGSNQAGIFNDIPNVEQDLSPDTNSAIVDFTAAWGAETQCGSESVITEFAVRLRGRGHASLWITAKDDATGGIVFERSLRPGTINVPASAPGLLAVGCTVNRIGWTPFDGFPVFPVGPDPNPVPDGSCFFSASGPTPFGVEKPEISAPGSFIVGAMSADADPRSNPGGIFDFANCPQGEAYCAIVDKYHAVQEGTSMSTPHVAGAVALLMGIDPTLTQARATEVLQAGARLPTGDVPDPTQLGPGTLDVEGARLALLASMGAPLAPDLTKSWFVLSSPYARPDPSFPVWVTIELRRSDNTPATGIDGSKLSFSLARGGTTYQPIARVRQGLFRFAIAGLPRDLGETITLDVSYAGQSLGQSAIPVGWDPWSATDPSVTAVGACAVNADPPVPPTGTAVAMTLAAALTAVRRRRGSRHVVVR
jgi:subtilisin family serine protease